MASPDTTFAACPRCGVLVVDRDAHSAWHRDLDRLEKK